MEFVIPLALCFSGVILSAVLVKWYLHPFILVATEKKGDPGLRKFIESNKFTCLNRRFPLGKDSLLHTAVKVENRNAVDLLLGEGADPNYQNRFGDTPLHSACMARDVRLLKRAIVKELIRYGALVNLKNKEGLTPIDVARESGNDHLAAILDRHLASELKKKPVND